MRATLTKDSTLKTNTVVMAPVMPKPAYKNPPNAGPMMAENCQMVLFSVVA